MKYEAVIFDIGGVLVRTLDWSARHQWEDRLNLPVDGLSTLVFDSEPARLASIGEGWDEHIWQLVAEQCVLETDELSQLRLDFWIGDALNVELADFLRSLRPRFKTGILSNAWSEMRDMNRQRFGMSDIVDKTVYSFEIGVLKPTRQSFDYILKSLDVEPSHAIFVDDFEKNVHGARDAGMTAVRFIDTLQTIGELNALLGI
jgi:HAD superfamily hydrolase (TIGR01509 family)